MTEMLRVLLVEDSATDAKLITRELQRSHASLHVERVQDGPSMRAALEASHWSVVICDWSLPHFSGAAALELVQELRLDIPFIIVSGTVGEETAVEAMRSGAHDYVLKDKLARLPAAVERELRRHAERAAHRHREDEHRHLERRYRRIIENAKEGICILDAEHRFSFLSPRMEQMLGYGPGELQGASVLKVVGETEHDSAHETLARRREGLSETGEVKLLRKDGQVLWVLRSSSPIVDEEGRYEGIFAMVMDITDRKRAEDALHRTEDQLRHAQKMEAVGRLAGGVAHDFNNLLSIVLSYADLIAETLAPSDPIRADLKEIRTAGERATDLTRQLLAFSRHQTLQLRVLDLNAILTERANMLPRLLGEDIELKLCPCAGPCWKVKADPGQVEQVLMNLLVNARDAMPNGGKLTVEIENVELDEAYAQVHVGVTPGPHVMLAVSDTGVGMDRATLARIFEPFFTTKELGKGTGLGLSTVYGIVQQSGGTIWVYSEPGHGTTFKVYFPRTEETSEAWVPSHSHPAARGGTETILLVEDEPQVRTLVYGILKRNGYDVIEAASGGEALLISEQHGGRIHLLLTDVVMPRMNGRQLAERLATTRRDLKTLYMSGYTGNAVAHHGVLDEDVVFLQKPVTPDVLLRAVRSVLDGPPGTTSA